MRFFIDMLPPPELFPNAARRTHWRKKHALSAPIREYAAHMIQQHMRDPETTDHLLVLASDDVKLTIEVAWEKGRRMPDLDAIPLACKAYVDALVDTGPLYNDSQVHELVVRQRRAYEETAGVYLTVEEA